jgi:hypothetical protein
MINTILTGVALLATTALAGPGSAVVINACDYDVQLSNTPSAGGGYNAINKVLSSNGGSYSQVYTELTNGNGWSLKLAKTDNFISNVMQYEYTYHNDGTIWFDLSEVNGNPWDGNWEITATSGCTPRQAAYRFSTDDAYGMQSCADTASITVTLCSGTSGGAPSSPGWGPSSPSQAPAPTSEAPAPQQSWGLGNKVVESPAGNVVDNKQAPTPSPSPTPSADAWNGPAVTVTNIAYETVTQIVTAAGRPHKRHVHHPRHPHGHA